MTPRTDDPVTYGDLHSQSTAFVRASRADEAELWKITWQCRLTVYVCGADSLLIEACWHPQQKVRLRRRADATHAHGHWPGLSSGPEDLQAGAQHIQDPRPWSVMVLLQTCLGYDRELPQGQARVGKPFC